jgi:hypothetical protein
MWRLPGFLICLFAISVCSQVVPSGDVDSETRALQKRYVYELNAIAADITEHRFLYHLYLTRRVGVDERTLRHKQENSVHFASFRGQIVLAVSGNYYAAYSTKLVSKEGRAERTFAM